MNKIEVVSDKISLLGECPLWDSEKVTFSPKTDSNIMLVFFV
jgi:hypothetical protein